VLYPKVRNSIGGDIPVDVPPTEILGDVSPASPAGLTSSLPILLSISVFYFLVFLFSTFQFLVPCITHTCMYSDVRKA